MPIIVGTFRLGFKQISNFRFWTNAHERLFCRTVYLCQLAFSTHSYSVSSFIGMFLSYCISSLLFSYSSSISFLIFTAIFVNRRGSVSFVTCMYVVEHLFLRNWGREGRAEGVCGEGVDHEIDGEPRGTTEDSHPGHFYTLLTTKV